MGHTTIQISKPQIDLIMGAGICSACVPAEPNRTQTHPIHPTQSPSANSDKSIRASAQSQAVVPQSPPNSADSANSLNAIRNILTLNHIIKNERLKQLFEEFLTKHYCKESFDFLKMVADRSYDRPFSPTFYNCLFETYLKEQAENELNLPGQLKEYRSLESQPIAVQTAQREVSTMLTGLIPEFIRYPNVCREILSPLSST